MQWPRRAAARAGCACAIQRGAGAATPYAGAGARAAVVGARGGDERLDLAPPVVEGGLARVEPDAEVVAARRDRCLGGRVQAERREEEPSLARVAPHAQRLEAAERQRAHARELAPLRRGERGAAVHHGERHAAPHGLVQALAQGARERHVGRDEDEALARVGDELLQPPGGSGGGEEFGHGERGRGERSHSRRVGRRGVTAGRRRRHPLVRRGPNRPAPPRQPARRAAQPARRRRAAPTPPIATSPPATSAHVPGSGTTATFCPVRT
jgi:hypothetical protein